MAGRLSGCLAAAKKANTFAAVKRDVEDWEASDEAKA